MAEKITTLLQEGMNVASLEVVNESYLHQGHAGDDGSGQTHFKLKVVSPDFLNMSRVQSQKHVLAILKPLFNQGLHALSIQALKE